MANGGWLYKYYEWPVEALSQADALTRFTEMVTKFEEVAGWSNHTAANIHYNYATTRFAMYAVSQHTDTTLLVWMVSIYVTGCHANNYYRLVNYSNNDSYGPVPYVAMVPAGSSLGAGTPSTDGFLPVDAIKFMPIASESEFMRNTVYSTTPAVVHMMTRGSDAIFIGERLTTAGRDIQGLVVMGDLITDLAHTPTDTHTHIGFGLEEDYAYGDRLTNEPRLQFLKADGSYCFGYATGSGGWVATTTCRYAFMSSLLTGYVCDRPPWTWVPLMLYTTSIDLDADGVVAGDGRKGVLNTEAIRIGIPVQKKQTLEGGNFIHIQNGVCVGWDPSNDPMY